MGNYLQTIDIFLKQKVIQALAKHPKVLTFAIGVAITAGMTIVLGSGASWSSSGYFTGCCVTCGSGYWGS
jgi:hypothetical protein